MFRTIRSAAVALILMPAAAVAQQGVTAARRALSLDEALRMAESQSEAVHIAQAGVLRAHGSQMQAFSQYLPQLNGTVNYTRTLASQFSALQSAPAPAPPAGTPPVPPTDTMRFFTPCTRYLAPAGAGEIERVLGLENFARCSSSGGTGIDFTKVGFGAANQYNLGLSGSMTLFSGGRVSAQNRAANAGRRTADIELAAQRAQLSLDVTEAYTDAVLADRLVAIAESSLAQTESVLQQTRLAREVGNQSEFELLRAQVTRDNQVPAVLQRRTNRDLAYLRIKQILNLPAREPLTLSTQLADENDLLAASRTTGVPSVLSAAEADTSANDRAPVRQLMESLVAQEAQLRVARSEAFPTLTVSSSYGRLAFPTGAVPSWSNFLTNWTVTVGASMPLFTGGRIRGSEMVAEASLREARERVQQVRELAALDAEQTVAQLDQAEAALKASVGTAAQAAKAYTIAEVRFREGLSTQVELNDARLLQQQASANRAQAIRNLQVARTRLALLKNLPLGAGASAGAQQPPQ
jgi:outer membrane protein TolC